MHIMFSFVVCPFFLKMVDENSLKTQSGEDYLLNSSCDCYRIIKCRVQFLKGFLKRKVQNGSTFKT